MRRGLAAAPTAPRRLHLVGPAPLAAWQARRRAAIDRELAGLRRELAALRRERWGEAPTCCGRCGCRVAPPRQLCRRCNLALSWPA